MKPEHPIKPRQALPPSSASPSTHAETATEHQAARKELARDLAILIRRHLRRSNPNVAESAEPSQARTETSTRKES